MLASDEGRESRPVGIDAYAPEWRASAPGRERVGLALHHDRFELLVVDHVPRRLVRVLADEESADRSRRLEPRSGVDDVAGDDSLADVGTGVERHNRFACIDGAPHREPESLVVIHLIDRGEDAQPGSNRSLGIVLVSHRRAEHGHDRVADEFLDRALVALDLAFEPRVVGAEQCAHVLGVGSVEAAGESDEIDEEDRDDLALLA